MAKIHWKGSALLAPVPPVMVTCGDMENANIITVAWAGIINTHPPRVSIAVRPTRYSYGIIKERGEFVINLTPAALARECDFCGIYTGAKVDKFARTGLHKEPAQAVACPIIAECPLALECKVLDILPQGTHDLFLAEVVGVDVDEALLDENGKLCLDRAGLAAFAHGEYFALGERLGSFGFSVAKKEKSAPKKEAARGGNASRSDREKPATATPKGNGAPLPSPKGADTVGTPAEKSVSMKPHSKKGKAHGKAPAKKKPYRKGTLR